MGPVEYSIRPFHHVLNVVVCFIEVLSCSYECCVVDKSNYAFARMVDLARRMRGALHSAYMSIDRGHPWQHPLAGRRDSDSWSSNSRWICCCVSIVPIQLQYSLLCSGLSCLLGDGPCACCGTLLECRVRARILLNLSARLSLC